jgi:hypothetical protein
MWYLQTNLDSQPLPFSLKEARLVLSSFTDYLFVVVNETSGEQFALIPQVTIETDRVTWLTIGTNTNNATNGSVTISLSGRYHFTIYGQNSDTNLDPTDASVVGVVKKGYIELTHNFAYYESQTLNIPTDIIYNGQQ